MKKFEIELTCNHQSFLFDLCHRELNFGNAGTGEYYWMDRRGLRGGGENLRSCINFWWACVEKARMDTNWYNQVNLVLAETYLLVNKSRAMQDVFLDAQLSKNADRKVEYELDNQGHSRRLTQRTFQLPEEEVKRLEELVNGRNIGEIQRELEQMFAGDRPPENERPAFDKSFQVWTNKGVDALLEKGRQGLDDYIQKDLGMHISKFRKGGSKAGINDRLRMFMNMFSYECKVAFYLCYASAWMSLLPELLRRKLVNRNAVRFMRLWHHQNQSQEIEDGKRIKFFHGQVLSLHPLSAIIMTDPSSLAVIGKWIGHPDYQRLKNENKVGDSQEYWNVVQTILVAAHEYKQSHERWNNARGQTEISLPAVVEQTSSGEPAPSFEEVFEAYASEHSIICKKCPAPLEYINHDPVAKGESSPVTYRCSRCQLPRTINVEYEALKESLLLAK